MSNHNEGVSVLSEKTKTSPGKPNLKGILSAIAFIILFAGTVSFISYYVNNEAEKEVDAFIEKIQTDSEGDLEITYESASASLFDDHIDISGVTIYDNKEDKVRTLTADKIRFSLDGYKAGEKLPVSARINIGNMTIKSENITQKILESSGIDYKERTINIHGGFDYTEINNGTIKFSGSISVSGLNKISIASHITSIGDAWAQLESHYRKVEVDTEMASDNTDQMMADLGEGILESMSLIYENKGEIGHYINQISEKSDDSEREIKEQLAKAVDQALGKTQLAGELKKFIEIPEKIVISIDPQKQINISELPMIFMGFTMGRHQTLIEHLNITLKAN